MTSKLKCPFCGTELGWCLSCPMPTIICSNENCKGFSFLMPPHCWQELIQAKQDLEIAKADIEDYKKYKALWEQIRNNTILELERKLEIAREALKGTVSYYEHYAEFDGEISWDGVALIMRNDAHEALKQIEHKEM